MGKPITNIKQNSDGTISFDFKRNVDLSDKPDPWADVLAAIKDIETSTATAKSPSRIYTIDGRYAGTDTKLLKKGLYIVNGKKIIK